MFWPSGFQYPKRERTQSPSRLDLNPERRKSHLA